MKIAVFTPLNPLKSGISDFSEELLPYLKKYFEIDIFVDGYKPTNKEIRNMFNIYDMVEFDKREVRMQYDEIIYHVGNNEECHKNIVKYAQKYSGIIELHDVSLHHMLAASTIVKNDYDRYIKEMEYCHGEEGKKIAEKFINGEIAPPWETEPLKYNVIKRILDKAKAVIVHSDFAKQMVKAICKKPVYSIPLHVSNIEENYEQIKNNTRRKLGVHLDSFIIASFGFVNANKRIEQILYALKKLADLGVEFKYYIVGQVLSKEIKDKIVELNLKNSVKITGYVNIDEFKDFMKMADICLNLRYPTLGETSGSLHRMLGMGKVVFVTDIGSYSEYPDDIVVKVKYGPTEVEEIYTKIKGLLMDRKLNEIYSRNAIKYAKENYSLKKNAAKYKAVINSINNGVFIETDLAELFTDILEGLKIYDKQLVKCILKN